jgi:hypothetical protein
MKPGTRPFGRVNPRAGFNNYAIYTLFFLSVDLVEPIRFGSVQSISYFGNRNRTELELFCDFLIG